MLDVIRRELQKYEGQWILPDDLDALLEIVWGAIGEALEYGRSESRTHWAECWRYTSHHPCAVAEVERLQQELKEVIERHYSVVE